jgi:hypothetical protein
MRSHAVPRYFFNQIDGQYKPDDEGLEFQSLDQARTEAVRYAGAVLCHEPDVVWEGDDFRVEVTDEKKLLLFTLIVVGVDAPTGGRSSNSALNGPANATNRHLGRTRRKPENHSRHATRRACARDSGRESGHYGRGLTPLNIARPRNRPARLKNTEPTI